MSALKKMDGQKHIKMSIWQYTVCDSFANGIENDCTL